MDLQVPKKRSKNSGICFVQVPDGVDFNGEKAYLLVGVAGKGEEHVELLGKIGQTLMDEGVIEKLKKFDIKRRSYQLIKSIDDNAASNESKGCCNQRKVEYNT